MRRPEFEERQFGDALVDEISAGLRWAVTPGQVIENILGFDAATTMGAALASRVASGAAPPGLVLQPGHWSGLPNQPEAKVLPRFVVSLILQHKRPEFHDHWSSRQYHHWRGPYYRFSVEEHQHHVLQTLEGRVVARALVRYSSPAFLTYDELYDLQMRSLLSERSTFVAPTALGPHRTWSYRDGGTHGYANPEPGEEAEADNLDTLLTQAEDLASERGESFEDHVLRLSDDLADQPSSWPTWGEFLEATDGPVWLGAFARITVILAQAWCSWLIIEPTRAR